MRPARDEREPHHAQAPRPVRTLQPLVLGEGEEHAHADVIGHPHAHRVQDLGEVLDRGAHVRTGILPPQQDDVVGEITHLQDGAAHEKLPESRGHGEEHQDPRQRDAVVEEEQHVVPEDPHVLHHEAEHGVQPHALMLFRVAHRIRAPSLREPALVVTREPPRRPRKVRVDEELEKHGDEEEVERDALDDLARVGQRSE